MLQALSGPFADTLRRMQLSGGTLDVTALNDLRRVLTVYIKDILFKDVAIAKSSAKNSYILIFMKIHFAELSRLHVSFL